MVNIIFNIRVTPDLSWFPQITTTNTLQRGAYEGFKKAHKKNFLPNIKASIKIHIKKER